jgi:hypothetical protein
MAKCDEGYMCDVCGQDVAEIYESDLYLRYVLGQVDPERLHVTKERHIRCNPAVAQFIVHADFPPVIYEGAFAKQHLDSTFVQAQETLITSGWLRLREIATSEVELSLLEYPLAEVRANMKKKFG